MGVIEKLRSKHQADFQLQQAHEAVSIYYDIRNSAKSNLPLKPLNDPLDGVTEKKQIPTTKEKWWQTIDQLSNEIKVRHYSPKTLKTYRSWAIKYLRFVNYQKDPEDLDSEDVKQFLTHLAVDQKVAASSQNLAFNALLCSFSIAMFWGKSSERLMVWSGLKSVKRFPWYCRKMRLMQFSKK